MHLKFWNSGTLGGEWDLLADTSKAGTWRPGARFGPTGISQGSRRMSESFAWSIYNGESFANHPILPKLTSPMGKDSYLSWAEILDCGDPF